MGSIYVAPDPISPRSLDVATLDETRVGAFIAAVGVGAAAVGKSVGVVVAKGTQPAVKTGFGVTVAVALI